tara:strand:+ start:912 stop:1160 length:249 start_codon:yes stop_codon:yes gene_type:complete
LGLKPDYMGPYKATQEDLDIRMWCYRNSISVVPVQVKYGKRQWYIEITINGKSNTSPESYTHLDIWNKVLQFRKYYYNKYAK